MVFLAERWREKGDDTLPVMQGRAVCEAAAPPLGLATAGGRLSTKAASCLM